MKWRSLEETESRAESRSLREIYAERKALIERYVPAEIRAVHARVVADLQQSGASERALKVGEAAPNFELPDQNGKRVGLRELLDEGPVVVSFIRGRWCPFCVGQLEAMNAIVAEMKQCRASFLTISPQTVHQNDLMADQHKLRFPVMSDTGNQVTRRFGLVYRVPEHQQEVYSRAFVNLPFVNGDATWELPIPATYILRKPEHAEARDSIGDAVVVHASVNPDYTERIEPREILDVLARMA